MASPEPEASKATRVLLKKEASKLKLDFNELKSGGFIKQIQKDLFVMRLRCPGGMLTPARLRKAADIAEKYVSGQIHLSIRQSVEIIGVHHKDFKADTEELSQIGWSVASWCPRIRVPNTCGGFSYNPNGASTPCTATRWPASSPTSKRWNWCPKPCSGTAPWPRA